MNSMILKDNKNNNTELKHGDTFYSRHIAFNPVLKNSTRPLTQASKNKTRAIKSSVITRRTGRVKILIIVLKISCL